MTIVDYQGTLNFCGELGPFKARLEALPGAQIVAERGATYSRRMFKQRDMDVAETLADLAAALVANHAALFSALEQAGVRVELLLHWEIPILSGQTLTTACMRSLGSLNICLVLDIVEVHGEH